MIDSLKNLTPARCHEILTKGTGALSTRPRQQTVEEWNAELAAAAPKVESFNVPSYKLPGGETSEEWQALEEMRLLHEEEEPPPILTTLEEKRELDAQAAAYDATLSPRNRSRKRR